MQADRDCIHVDVYVYVSARSRCNRTSSGSIAFEDSTYRDKPAHGLHTVDMLPSISRSRS